MIFGGRDVNVTPLVLNGTPIDYVTEWKYLGTTITGGDSLGFSACPDLTAFFKGY